MTSESECFLVRTYLVKEGMAPPDPKLAEARPHGRIGGSSYLSKARDYEAHLASSACRSRGCRRNDRHHHLCSYSPSPYCSSPASPSRTSLSCPQGSVLHKPSLAITVVFFFLAQPPGLAASATSPAALTESMRELVHSHEPPK